jgi:phosphoribosylformylglycinamidine synthase
VVAHAPIAYLNNPPVYRFHPKRPVWLDGLQSLDLTKIKDIAAKDAGRALLRLLSAPNICSKRPVFRQYDHQVGNNSVVLPGGGDAAVMRIQETTKAYTLVTDGNGRYCYVNPLIGGVIAVAEAARNTACMGARPMAITNCLNFGNPERNDVMYQMHQCIRGMSQACKKLRTPVVSGNVSLYNETRGVAIFPTPVVGMVGLIKDAKRRCTAGFKSEGDAVFLLGDPGGDQSLGSSEYLELVHGEVRGSQSIDLRTEKSLHDLLIKAIGRGLLRSAHDCSDGGLVVALVESCIIGDTGFRGALPVHGRLDAALFGEAQSRAVVSVSPGAVRRLEEMAFKYGVPVTRLGKVGGRLFILRGLVDLPVSDLVQAWSNGLKI